MSTIINIIFFNNWETWIYTAAILNIEKNNNKKSAKIQKSSKQQILNEKDIYDLYQPVIDKVIYIDDQLILLNQLISALKTSKNMPLDSVSVLNMAEYITNMSRTVFKDANMLINEIFHFDLNSARNDRLQTKA